MRDRPTTTPRRARPQRPAAPSAAGPSPSPDGDSTAALLQQVYRRLYHAYGPQHWWPGDGGPLEVCVGAILTQACAWGNVERALANLKGAGVLSARGLRDVPLEELARLLYPCGYFNVKARKVKAFVAHLWERHGGEVRRLLAQPPERLRQELLAVYGIGEETADDILLYAAGHPSFVVDAYTRRVLARLGVTPDGQRYAHYQELFHRHLPRDAALFNEYHALLVRLGKDVCRKEPRCPQCPLLPLCPTGQGRAPRAAPPTP